jgi:hypothetical protein
MSQFFFEIKSDFDFYCYLKAHLPNGYSIVSEPQKSYYSEWQFHYIIYHGDKKFKEYSGNFLEIEKGSLVKQAKSLMNELEKIIC